MIRDPAIAICIVRGYRPADVVALADWLGVIVVAGALGDRHPRLSAPANHPFARGMSINPVLADNVIGRVGSDQKQGSEVRQIVRGREGTAVTVRETPPVTIMLTCLSLPEAREHPVLPAAERESLARQPEAR